MLAGRLRVRPHNAVLLAPRTAQDAAHIISSLSFVSASCHAQFADYPALSCPRIDDLLFSVKKTKVPCGSPVERNGVFIGDPHRLHTHLWKPHD